MLCFLFFKISLHKNKNVNYTKKQIIIENKEYEILQKLNKIFSFNYKVLNLKSKNEYKRNWGDTNFIGFKVIDNTNKIKKEGKIIHILEKLVNGFPKYVIVQWGENLFTKEYVIFSNEQINKNLIIKLENSKLKITELEKYTELNKFVEFKKIPRPQKRAQLFDLPKINNYKGKFKNEKRINFGASPEARASVDKEYFSLQRLYEVNQNLTADYLNQKRTKKRLSKKELTNCFPHKYKHTVGHWLRKDFGGSLPKLDDWKKITQILDIDENMTNYVCKTALKIQTVKHA